MVKLYSAIVLISSILYTTYANALEAVTYNLKPFHYNVHGRAFGGESRVQGALADLPREWFQKAGVRYTLNLRSPKGRAVMSVESKDDGAIFLIGKTDELSKTFDFIGPVVKLEYAMFASTQFENPASSIEGVTSEQLVLVSPSEVNNYLKTLNLRGTVFDHDRTVARFIVSTPNHYWPMEALYGKRMQRAFNDLLSLNKLFTYYSEDLYLAVNKKLPEREKQSLTRALSELQASGRIQQMLDAYLAQENVD